jgi:hypothetical protein
MLPELKHLENEVSDLEPKLTNVPLTNLPAKSRGTLHFLPRATNFLCQDYLTHVFSPSSSCSEPDRSLRQRYHFPFHLFSYAFHAALR